MAWKGIKGVINSLMTEDDDKVPDFVKYAAALAVGIFLGAGCRAAYANTFNFTDFGTGFGALLLGIGGAIWLKTKADKE